MMANVRRFAVAYASSFCSDEAVRICGAAYHTDGGDGRVRTLVERLTARLGKAEDIRTHQARTDESTRLWRYNPVQSVRHNVMPSWREFVVRDELLHPSRAVDFILINRGALSLRQEYASCR
jgi:hypothetical protein